MKTFKISIKYLLGSKNICIAIKLENKLAKVLFETISCLVFNPKIIKEKIWK